MLPRLILGLALLLGQKAAFMAIVSGLGFLYARQAAARVWPLLEFWQTLLIGTAAAALILVVLLAAQRLMGVLLAIVLAAYAVVQATEFLPAVSTAVLLALFIGIVVVAALIAGVFLSAAVRVGITVCGAVLIVEALGLSGRMAMGSVAGVSLAGMFAQFLLRRRRRETAQDPPPG